MNTINFDATHGDVSSRQAHGTGQWLLESNEFESWLGSVTNVTLWCRGIPGAGKTVLTSIILDRLYSLKGNDLSIGVAGVYCSYRDPQAVTNLFGSVLQQLAESLKNIPFSIPEDKPLSMKTVLEALLTITSSYQQVFIVFDALDECANRLELLKELGKLLQAVSSKSAPPTSSCSNIPPPSTAWNPYFYFTVSLPSRCVYQIEVVVADHSPSDTRLRILITSRSGITDIERSIKADIRVEIRSNENDVRLYLQNALRDQELLSDWILESPEFETSIFEAILPRLSGMFLLARLYIDLLAQIPTKKGVRKALKTLPKGIYDTYAEA